MTHNTISAERLLLTARKDFYSALRGGITSSVTVLVALVFIGLIGGYTGSVPYETYDNYFRSILIIGGLIATAAAFRDRHGKDSIHNWLMLPASTLEKYLVRFAFTTAGVILISLAVVWLSSLFTGILNNLIFSLPFFLYNPFADPYAWQIIQGYLAAHSLFFLGATWFRKNHFIKTVLTLLVIQICLSIFASGTGYLLFFRLTGPGVFSPHNIFTIEQFSHFRLMKILFRILIQAVIPVTCWTAAYFRLKEAEIKDGV